jgi:hypothetical protein
MLPASAGAAGAAAASAATAGLLQRRLAWRRSSRLLGQRLPGGMQLQLQPQAQAAPLALLAPPLVLVLVLVLVVAALLLAGWRQRPAAWRQTP